MTSPVTSTSVATDGAEEVAGAIRAQHHLRHLGDRQVVEPRAAVDVLYEERVLTERGRCVIARLKEAELHVAGAYLPNTGGCGGGGMLPLSNAYPTCCLVGTGCGNLSGTCC